MSQPHIFVKCINCLCMSSAFKELSCDQLTRVDKHRTELKYKKGETLCKEGSFISNLIFIKKGMVKIYLDRGDEPAIISIEKNGAFIGLCSVYGERVFHYTAEALTDTEVCLTDINTFRNLIEENSKFASEIIKLISHDLVWSYDRMYSFTNNQIHGRFAKLLLYFMDYLCGTNPFTLPISRIDMSHIVSTSNENISRLIQEFKKEKIIKLKGSECEILDVKRLIDISQNR